jgi:uncharacterized protein (DUF433 family)
MTARAIVRDADVLSGRWHFEGTTIPIAAIVSDHQFGRTEVMEQYHFMHLTDEEITNALLFEFPAVREPMAFVEYASITMECACGEDTRKAATTPAIESIECPCRRTWTVAIEPRLESYRPPQAAGNGAR